MDKLHIITSTTNTKVLPSGGYETLHVSDVDEHIASLWVYRERVVQEARPLPVDTVNSIGDVSKIVPTGRGKGWRILDTRTRSCPSIMLRRYINTTGPFRGLISIYV